MTKIVLVVAVSLSLGGCRKERVADDDRRVTRVDAARAPCSGEPPVPKTQLEGWPQKKLADLPAEAAAREDKRFEVEGVVVRAYVPTPCPEGAMCKPQDSPHVAVADAKGGEAKLALFTPDSRSIPEGVPLRFSFVLCARRTVARMEGDLAAWTKVP